ncbi:dihydrolipoamide acetyltransferase family protein [Streptomyces radicis]|uniref:Dihydrolipoamide acetyltransferase component of pyruvate dehydrogenase complex n=1 Tax=Streptomyces radicis TaxID=1750517 RepID=A0A3A9WF07_9ACTN|nr:dihydrolipoamide acetyltransferase family protein [Streptomyces radicis]RKN11360.1 2-oxo acid dehydrogenase subunit E2 [Streptomyces radicis]RKN26617.1 2-oxo acid dehydrogenase subunit E2 [Streptomyces radicis]
MSGETREFLLPDLGEGLTGAEIVRWLVEVGDEIAVDQPVVEVETAKARVEVPCPYAGTVTARFGEPGAEIPVGDPLIRVGAAAPATSSGAGPVLVGYGPEHRSPAPTPTRARRGGPGTGPPAAPNGVASPLVRRLARERGIDLRSVDGSGPGGLIVRSDIERVGAQRVGAQRAGGERVDGERVPLRGVRGATADKLTRSHAEIPAVTCWVDADATELLAARRATDLPLLALLARISVAVLAEHPALNASFDAATREIVTHEAVHLGFAAQTERGTLVPVVRDAQALTTRRLGEELGRLTAEARAGTLPPAALRGSTFTLNNYGVFGVDGSTPLLNHPEAAMLGIGRVTEKPWAHNGQLALRHVVQLTLTFDHRVCDGATAGGALRRAADIVESPVRLLADV